MRHLALLALALCVVAAGCGGGAQVPAATDAVAQRGVLAAVMVEKGPAIDGTLDSPLWRACPRLELGGLQGDQTGKLRTDAWVLLDSSNLYVAMQCHEADTASLTADATARDEEVWRDDSVELFVAPDIDAGYYHFAVNSKGVLQDGRAVGGGEHDESWNSSAKTAASVVAGKGWIVTISVPLKDLAVKSGPSQTWLLNLNRTKPAEGWIESSWSATGTNDYHYSGNWGKLTGVNIP